MFTKILEKKTNSDRARRLYKNALAQSRLPIFYEKYDVPDSIDGRFEMIALHVFIILHRLKQDDSRDDGLSQALFDHMFRDLDHALREMGIGDLGVGRKVKAMAKAFYGRIAAFEGGLDNEKELSEAILRNVFRGQEIKAPNAIKLTKYLKRQVAHLSNLENAELFSTNDLFEN